jgi:hypothetical protein
VKVARRTTFVFAGGTAFQDPIPSNLGFGLTVNGVKVLDFDTVKEGHTWKSADGRYVLSYVPVLSQSSWSGGTGLFYLSVPADAVTAGQPAQIRVHSIGSDNARWFMLNPYSDILDGAKVASAIP